MFPSESPFFPGQFFCYLFWFYPPYVSWGLVCVCFFLRYQLVFSRSFLVKSEGWVNSMISSAVVYILLLSTCLTTTWKFSPGALGRVGHDRANKLADFTLGKQESISIQTEDSKSAQTRNTQDTHSQTRRYSFVQSALA